MFVSDAVYLYLMLLNETLAGGGDYRDGSAFLEKAKHRSFRGQCRDRVQSQPRISIDL